jgi:hypothetical protein
MKKRVLGLAPKIAKRFATNIFWDPLLDFFMLLGAPIGTPKLSQNLPNVSNKGTPKRTAFG